jgi:hypothetical protein
MEKNKRINKIPGVINMSYITFSARIIIAGCFLFSPQKGFPADEQMRELQRVVEALENKTSQYDQLQSPSKITESSDIKPARKKKSPPVGMPIYKPPRRGAPVGRVAGGTRGILDEYPSILCVITPDHTALTIQDQPQLFWFLRELTNYPIELTIIEDQAIFPMLETRIDSPEQPGIQSIRLNDFGMHLKKDTVYKWFIAIVPDPNRRSKDILAWGAVRYMEISDELKEKLLQFDKVTALNIYASAGIWYDAFSELSELIKISTNDIDLIDKRNALLEQIGLLEITKYEKK